MSDWQALLEFWFGELVEGFADDAHRHQWFTPNAEFDVRCRELFGASLASAAKGDLTDWLDAPKSCLAYILVCDQIPRNIYRGTKDAFATDELALNAARHGIENGFDQALAWDERSFFYMPFEHSESIVDQHTAVGLFSASRDASPKSARDILGNQLRFAHQHRDIILKFGRFPHRNHLFGRASSAAEEAFVAAGDGFGQNIDDAN